MIHEAEIALETEEVDCKNEAVSGAADSIGETSEDNKSGSMMAMRLATQGLQFDIKTAIDTDHRIVDLTARLEVTCRILAETTMRLEQAHMRIGRLENELSRNCSD